MAPFLAVGLIECNNHYIHNHRTKIQARNIVSDQLVRHLTVPMMGRAGSSLGGASLSVGGLSAPMGPRVPFVG